MKKQIALGLGIMTVCTASVPIFSASREAYHAYLMAPKEKIYSDEGYFPNPSYLGQRWYNSQDLAVRPNTGAIRGHLGKARQEDDCGPIALRSYGGYPQQQAREFPQIYSNSQSSYPRASYEGPVADNNIDSFLTYNNNVFSVQLPEQWKESAVGSQFFIGPDNYTVSVEKFEKGVCQENENFTACTARISAELNQNNLGGLRLVSKPIRQSQFLDTILNTQLQTRTYTESFLAEGVSNSTKYITRFFVADLDGGVYVVETQTGETQKEEFVGVTKKIMDSFRIYPEYQVASSQ